MQSCLSDSWHECSMLLGEHKGFFFCCLTAWPMPNRAVGSTPQKHFGLLWSCWVKCCWSISPLSERQVPRAVAVYSNVYQREKGVVQASSQQKRHPAALCKRQSWCIAHEKTNQSHETRFRLSPFSHPDGHYETRRHEVCAWVCLRWQNHAGGLR